MSSFVLALPLLCQFLIIATIKNFNFTKTRFTCLNESLFLVKALSEPAQINLQIELDSLELGKKISAERVSYPVFVPGSPSFFSGRLVYRLKEGPLCGAELQKEGPRWIYRLVYETEKGKY